MLGGLAALGFGARRRRRTDFGASRSRTLPFTHGVGRSGVEAGQPEWRSALLGDGASRL